MCTALFYMFFYKVSFMFIKLPMFKITYFLTFVSSHFAKPAWPPEAARTAINSCEFSAWLFGELVLVTYSYNRNIVKVHVLVFQGRCVHFMVSVCNEFRCV